MFFSLLLPNCKATKCLESETNNIFFSDPINRNCYWSGSFFEARISYLVSLFFFYFFYHFRKKQMDLGRYLSRGSLACKTDHCLSNSLITLLLCPKIDCIDLGQTCN